MGFVICGGGEDDGDEAVQRVQHQHHRQEVLLASLDAQALAQRVEGDPELGGFVERYGPDNVDLWDMEQMGGCAQALSRRIRDTIDDLPEAVRAHPKNLALIKEALYPDEGFLGGHQYLKQGDADFADARAETILAVLRTVQERAAELTGVVGLGDELDRIELTGSDFHNGGQQVCILVAKDGSRSVYKPRSTATDRALVGSGGGSAFSALNALGFELNTMDFFEAGDGSHSAVAFQNRAWVKTAEQIREHYRRLGHLVVATKLLGVDDLHQENVMSVAGGSTIIDGETAFLPWRFVQGGGGTDFNASGINGVYGALTDFCGPQDGKLQNNAFYTAEEAAGYPGEIDHDSEEFGRYIAGLRAQDLKGAGNYRDALIAGITQALDAGAARADDVVQAIGNAMRAARDVRVVPMPTQDFVGIIRDTHDFRRDNEDREEREREEQLAMRIDYAADTVISKLTSDRFRFAMLGGAKATVLRHIRTDILVTRDTPYFVYQPADGQLYYHGDAIARQTITWDNIEEAIRASLAVDVGHVIASLGL